MPDEQTFLYLKCRAEITDVHEAAAQLQASLDEAANAIEDFPTDFIDVKKWEEVTLNGEQRVYGKVELLPGDDENAPDPAFGSIIEMAGVFLVCDAVETASKRPFFPGQ